MLERRILECLTKRGMMSGTAIYRLFNRYRAFEKNKALSKLLSDGLIVQQTERSSSTARKPTNFYSLNKTS